MGAQVSGNFKAL